MTAKALAGLRQRQSGFSLLELLVAFAIMALSLGLLYRMAGGSARHVSDAIQTQQAVWLVESLLASRASVRADGWNEDGETGGFRWQVRSSRLPSEFSGPQYLQMHKIQLSVFWTLGSKPGQIDTVTLLPERKPKPGESVP